MCIFAAETIKQRRLWKQRFGRRSLPRWPSEPRHGKWASERWARRVCIVRAADTPLLSIYEFDESLLPADVRRLRLEHYDQQWLDFIVSSRRGKEPWRDYDIIEGGVANDQVIDTVEDYYADRITAEQAIGQLRFAKPTHQMCISRQAIVDHCLRFVGTEAVTEKGGQG